ncbi:ferritin-like domain-containing protein [Candidatus Micrarchaeota archaeon]|nr:ferritin-like domain-containing protein [Candidatus Micrarchaeota archaeon]
MGKVGKEIVELDVDGLVEELNKALADEWLAYMQYTSASKLVAHPSAVKELGEIAKEELEHADELTERIIQLGGKPIVDPKQYFEKTNCGYEIPTEDVVKVLKDSIKAEGCAIRVYNKIMKITEGKDLVTRQLMQHIMEEEINHEQRFENLLEWIK